jgi:transposase
MPSDTGNSRGRFQESRMVGRQDRWPDELFVACTVRELIPPDHILRRVNKLLDPGWLRSEVKELYDEYQGRPSIDPESAVRLMLAGFFQGIVHDRKLMREAQVNLAIRWFAGYRLDEKLPDHSSLTRIRQRWGEERFRRIFQKTVEQCVNAGLVDAETVHVDATLIRADVSWKSLAEKHAEQVIRENPERPDDDGGSPASKRGRPRTREKAPKKISRTDPEATLTTSCSTERMEPSYKQHTAVDDRAGVVVDVAVTTGEASEGEQLLAQVKRIEANTVKELTELTADASYAHAANYQGLEKGKIDAVIPPQKEPSRPGRMPLSRFKYDAKNQILRCPAGKLLRRIGRDERGWWHSAKRAACRRCRLRTSCFGGQRAARKVLIVNGYEALLRARRRRARWSAPDRRRYQRHRWRVEGIHGEAKTQHGLRRAVRRGLWNVAIQAYLTAAVINLKRLAALLYLIFLHAPRRANRPHRLFERFESRAKPDHEIRVSISVAA